MQGNEFVNKFRKGSPLSKVWVDVGKEKWRLEDGKYIRARGGAATVEAIADFITTENLPCTPQSIFIALENASLWLDEIQQVPK